MTTPQDLDRLSAYVDNQLSPSEKAKLEARLAREPELKAALADLRVTVRALRALPVIKPPRSFTLSPAQARVRPRRIIPALRLAAAASAAALAVVLAGDFALGASFRASPAAVPVSGAAVTREADAAETQARVFALAESVEVTSTPSRTEAQQELAGPTLEAAAAEELAATLPTETSTAALSATPAPPGADDFQPTLESAEKGVVGETGERAIAVPTSTPAAAADAYAPPPPTPGSEYPAGQLAPAPQAIDLTSVRGVEIGLALITALLALAAWFTRRS